MDTLSESLRPELEMLKAQTSVITTKAEAFEDAKNTRIAELAAEVESLNAEIAALKAGGVEHLRSPAEPGVGTEAAYAAVGLVPPAEPDREALADLIAEHLRGTYHCTRVWNAWNVGTMSQEDFEPIDESDTPGEIADAIIAKLDADRAARAQAPAAVEPVASQVPVHWRAVLDPEQVPHQLNPDLHDVGFRRERSGRSWVAEQLDFKGWRYTLEPLYAAPTTKAEPALKQCESVANLLDEFEVDVCKFHQTDTDIFKWISKVRAAVALPATPAAPADALDADMFWNDDDPEKQHNSIDEFLNDEICNGVLSIGDTRTLQRGYRLPNITIRVTAIDDNACEAEYEVIDAAIAAQAAQKGGAA